MPHPLSRLRRRRAALAAATGAVLAAAGGGLATAAAPTGVSAALSGGGVTEGGKLYVKPGTALKLTVTGSNVQCVQYGTEQDTRAPFEFAVPAPPAAGLQSVTVTAYEAVNPSGKCHKDSVTASTSYTVDSTGPVVTAALAPAPNGAGWNKADVGITWSASDPAGIASLAPASDSVTSNTSFTTRTATATDRLGNQATGSVPVKLDKSAPTVSATASASGWTNGNVTVAFACTDADGAFAGSGIKSCPATQSVTTEGEQTISGTATDNADNTASASAPVRIDKTAPTLSGRPATAPNAAGWYSGDVAVDWTATDALSGVTETPTTAVTGEGEGLVATASVADRAGNTRTAASAPAVNIDRTPPTTNAKAAADWSTSDEVTLTGADNLSGVAATRYSVDGGATRTYTGPLSLTEGDHTLRYWSVDRAGNAEAAKEITVKVDKTAPTITAALSPAPNALGWNRADVTVSFTCADDASGIASCSPDAVVAEETAGRTVTGTATDRAGNTATRTADVALDKTAPRVTASRDRGPNANGWYDDDVTVSFTCADDLSGSVACADPVRLGEGRGRSATGEGTDAAGNTGSATESGIDVDETNPTITGAATSAPNGAGWYRDDVTVRWTCDDALSGLAGDCPADETVGGEGAALGASANVADRAGNGATGTVGGLKIDRTAPVTTIDLPARVAGSDGWYGGPVTVALDATDGLSGVAKRYYRIDQGAAQEYTGAFTVDVRGRHELRAWSVDAAGNTEAAVLETINIDTDVPTIAARLSDVANDAGWHRFPVTVAFACADADSGVAACTPGRTVDTDGADQVVRGTAKDKVGNEASAEAKVSLDQVAPTVTGRATTDPNGHGWYRGDVTVGWTCDDALSGVDGACPADQTVTGEGEALSATSPTVTDRAGNPSLPGVVGGLRIDRTDPLTTVGLSDPVAGANGWYGGPVTATLSASDDRSGVDRRLYSVDGGQERTYGAPFAFGTSGTHVLRSWAVDKAGNTEAAKVDTVKIDVDGPAISAAATTAANAAGWYRGPVTVRFTCSDGQSGLASCPEDETVSADGKDQDVAGTATDKVGNTGQASTTVSVDGTAPVVTGSPTTQPIANGWYAGDVSVRWSCTDGLSGIAAGDCPADTVVTGEGDALSATSPVVSDRAGNPSQPGTVGPLKIDRTAPTGAIDVPASVTQDSLKVVVRAADAHSGVAGVKVNGESAVKEADGTFSRTVALACGPNTVTATVTDEVGRETAAGDRQVFRQCMGVSPALAPIATATGSQGNAAATNLQAFKIKSVVPVKFQVFHDLARTQLMTTPPAGSVATLKLVAVNGSTATSDVPEVVSVGNANTGDQFRWSALDSQYVYNLATSGRPAGKYAVQLTLKAADGTVLAQSALQYFVLRS